MHDPLKTIRKHWKNNKYLWMKLNLKNSRIGYTKRPFAHCIKVVPKRWFIFGQIR